MPKARSPAHGEKTPIPTIREAVSYLLRVIALMHAYWPRLAKGTLMGIGVGLVGMITPLISKLYFDRVYPSHDMTLLQVLVVGTFVLTVTNSILSSVKSYYSTTVGAQLSRSMSLMFFNHLHHLTVRFFDNHRVGEITSRSSDVRASIATVSNIFETVMLNGTFLLLVPPILFYMNPRLAILSLVSIPLTTTISTLSSRWVRRFSKQNLEASAEFSAFQVETLSHIRTIKGMAAEHIVFRSANEQLHRTMDLQLKSAVLGLGVAFVNTLVRGISQAVFTWFAWSAIIHQEMSLGEFVAFTAYMTYLSGPVGQFASLFVDFQTSAVSFGRMFEYLDLPVEQDPTLAYSPPGPIVHRIAGDITLSNIRFGYSSEKPVLRDLSLHIVPRTLNAIVGPSGAGKSSLLRLLCGMERPDSGQISFGDVRIEDISLPDLRRQLAVVWQEFSLMRGTILENLTYGLKDVSRERVDEAIRVCRLAELISSLPNGLDTTIAEWGATLSGGQRQRMAIARALIRDAPVLMLDEATSNIDAHTEGEILRDVFSRLEERTVIYVTHRVTTAALADRIFIIRDGRLVGAGSHLELMNDSAEYRELYSSGVTTVDDPRRLRIIGDVTSPRR